MNAFFSRLMPDQLKSKLSQVRNAAIHLAYSRIPGGGQLRRARLNALEQVPTQLNIEVTSVCNAKCIMCPRLEMERKMEIMPWDLYEKIITEARDLGIKRFALNGYGEIFTARKHYKKFISFVHDTVPGARILINTNASLLDKKAAEFVIDAQVDAVNVHIDGATKETFEKIRLGLNFETCVENVKQLIALRNAKGSRLPKVRVGIINQPANAHEVAQHRAYWEKVADFSGDDLLVNRGGDVGIESVYLRSSPCYLLWTEASILSDGTVALCCDDWDGKQPMGNVKTQTIAEIWTGAQWSAVREKHRSGKANEVSLCEKCNFSRPGPEWFHKANPSPSAAQR